MKLSAAATDAITEAWAAPREAYRVTPSMREKFERQLRTARYPSTKPPEAYMAELYLRDTKLRRD